MEIASHGTINIPEENLNLQVLVAPLQTVNKIQQMLPVIRKILPNNLAAVPIEVTGSFSDIKVNTMSISSISSKVFGIMTGALSKPVEALEENPTEKEQQD